jgi:hypothetical protein
MSKKRYLFPYKTRYIGIVLFLIHLPIKLLWDYYYPSGYRAPNPGGGESALFSPPHLFFIGTTLMVLVGLFLIAFSKEKVEDEQIVQLRLDSLHWAIYLNYAILLISLVLYTGHNSYHILLLNIWLPLLFFILRFQWVLYRLNRSTRQDETNL